MEPNKERTKEEIERSKKSKKSCCCLALLTIVLFIFGGYFFYRFFLFDYRNYDLPQLPVTADSSQEKPPETSTDSETSFPESEGQCQQINPYYAEAMGISPQNPGLHEDTNNHYYNIYGSTLNEVRSQLDDCRLNINGEKFAGHTHYYINWIYDYSQSGAKCGAKNVAVGINTEITIPKWQAPDSFQTGLDTTWNNYITALGNHENHHRDLAISGAQKILDQISSLGYYNNCTDLNSAIDSLGQQIIAETQQAQDSYDDNTNHGATEGANL